jgi:hypothetical protein
MFETMHYDIHVAKEQDLLHTAEMHRAFRILKSGRKNERGNTPIFGSIRTIVYGMLRRLRNMPGEVFAPGHQGS